ncbi:MAG: hypothetical protein OEV23_01630 [Gallionella sp.]|nr:hypothetical protein [Gallionella sp.]
MNFITTKGANHEKNAAITEYPHPGPVRLRDGRREHDHRRTDRFDKLGAEGDHLDRKRHSGLPGGVLDYALSSAQRADKVVLPKGSLHPDLPVTALFRLT